MIFSQEILCSSQSLTPAEHPGNPFCDAKNQRPPIYNQMGTRGNRTMCLIKSLKMQGYFAIVITSRQGGNKFC